MPRYSVSQPVRQLEAPRLLKGQGKYTDDVALPNQAFAIFLRSPYAHAEIKKIDIAKAEAILVYYEPLPVNVHTLRRIEALCLIFTKIAHKMKRSTKNMVMQAQ